MVNGIDVSDWQPNVHWQAVKEAGYSFAYTKATQGAGYTAATLSPNLEGLRRVGMLRGVYHMYDFHVTPEAQADYFLRAAHPTVGDLPPALDLELDTPLGADRAIQDVAKFLQIVEKSVGTKMVLYMAYGWWSSNFGSTDGFTGHPLWVAQYEYNAKEGSNPSEFPWIPGWDWTFWQHSDKQFVTGADQVDADWYRGSIEDLKKLTVK